MHDLVENTRPEIPEPVCLDRMVRSGLRGFSVPGRVGLCTAGTREAASLQDSTVHHDRRKLRPAALLMPSLQLCTVQPIVTSIRRHVG